MGKYLALVVLVSVTLSLIPLQHAYADGQITVWYNDKKLVFDAKPYAKDGRTLVPFRKILEEFGTKVSWDSERQVVIATKNATKVSLKIGTNYAYVNGSKVNLDVPPEISGGRTFVPLRFISENLGAEVKWEGSTNTVSITYNNNSYKLGQGGTYKDLKFSISKIDTSSEQGVLKVIGKLNFDASSAVLEVADEYGYVLPADIAITGKSGGMNNIEGKVILPGCHNFISKYVVIKKPNSENKIVKIAEYEVL
ncbi:copper amine oxidase N-terminal domain-containing protein [Pseudobacteroides cellulosolvens]|uniref:Copper amine oxidase-like domain-containing protein n=1 Tax=Pseudobacteroides cellulosolvens ATCC 35603 = DSM 2933 TaxID=398512 RepID=A0A0L6JQE0_9FIRM|nr:copper amine oxidase N-terminal domain-containing protein [Pseudobacteroides cellulosolvens]KNY28056.1 copper amine oxidase-like domain-containing protein [Pseudobacteroides cellulosolvens ATCC 35603 = DSM 2933]